jgi:hypothetical protein
MTPPTRTSRRRGLTMIELLLASSITALVGLGVAAMMDAVTTGTATQKNVRDAQVRMKVLQGRLDAALRNTQMVLQSSTDYVILWSDDTHADSVPDLSELRMIERDSATKVVTSYVAAWPAGSTQTTVEAADTAYTTATDFRTTLNAMKGTSKLTATKWASSVGSLAFTFNDTDPQLASLVTYKLLLTSGTDTQTGVGGVSIRNQ